ncbi:MAG: protein phosphatase 2C domain-containing protein [Cytophagales bacterium]|nr:protein phosphatase 2C domain-containing protein [Cytophagales bacterium]
MIEIASISQKFINKEKNGDYCIHQVINDQIFIAAVADGVSNQPCDWKASQVACEELRLQFTKMVDLSLSERLKQSVIKANEKVINESGVCANMSATLSVMCLNLTDHQGYFANVGDSRIYCTRNNQLQQLTTDDSIKRTKTIITEIGGRTVDASVLSKSLGMDHSTINIEIHPIQTEPGDLNILATDGFYSARVTFSNNMIQLSNSKSLQQDFESIAKKYLLLAGDDMTAIAFRLNS